jgi:hypothetical protein
VPPRNRSYDVSSLAIAPLSFPLPSLDLSLHEDRKNKRRMIYFQWKKHFEGNGELLFGIQLLEWLLHFHFNASVLVDTTLNGFFSSSFICFILDISNTVKSI